jgi:hypothetical protein
MLRTGWPLSPRAEASPQGWGGLSIDGYQSALSQPLFAATMCHLEQVQCMDCGFINALSCGRSVPPRFFFPPHFSTSRALR